MIRGGGAGWRAVYERDGRAKASGKGRQEAEFDEGQDARVVSSGLCGLGERWGSLLCVKDGNPDGGPKVADFALDCGGGQVAPETWLECGLWCPPL